MCRNDYTTICDCQPPVVGYIEFGLHKGCLRIGLCIVVWVVLVSAMTDDELKAEFRQIHEALEVIAKALADQQVLTIRSMSHQQAHLAALRKVMIRIGEARATLSQRLQAAYTEAISAYLAQLQAYHESGDVMKFVNSLVFTDETEHN